MSLDQKSRSLFSNIVATLCGLLQRPDFAKNEIDEGRALLTSAQHLLGTPELLLRHKSCECGRYVRFTDELPALPCHMCKPRETADALLAEWDRAGGRRTALFVYGQPIDRLQCDLTLADSLGRLYTFRSAHYSEGWPREHNEKLIAELQRTKDENTQLLAENARLRRAGERRGK